MITIETADPTPPYEQIRVQISTLIRSGELPAGHRLPSVRQLAADLRAAPGTIARSYRSLEAAGLVHCSRSGGTRVQPGNAVPDHVNRAVTTLIDTLAGDELDFEDLLAAVRTAWFRVHPDDPVEPGTPSADEPEGGTPEPSANP